MSLGSARLDVGAEIDARLVPAAMTVWCAVAAGILFSWWWTVVFGAVAAATAVVILVRGRWETAAAGALLVCGLLSAGVLAAGVRAAQEHPLRREAARGSVASLTVELTNRPKPLYRNGFGGQQSGASTVLVEGQAIEADVHGATVRAPADVLLFAPAQQWARLLIGQRVTAHGKLAPARAGELTVAVLRVRGPPSDVGEPGFGQRGAERLRAGLRESSAVLSPESAGLLPGLVDGDTSAVPHELMTDFRTAGLTHLTAVSGANLAVVCGAVLLLLRAFRVGPRLSAAAAGLALIGFVLLAGPDPSVLRSAVMGGIALLALAMGRQRSALPALATAVVVLICVDPAMAVNIGFLLSALATAALVILAPRWADGLCRRGVPFAVAQALVVPAAAHLVTAPVIAGISGQVSLVAIVANLLVAPVVAPATVFGVLAAVVSPLSTVLAHGFVWLAAPEVGWIVGVGTTSADLPGAAVPWPAGWFGALLLGAIVAIVLVCLRFRRMRVLVLLGLLGWLVIVVPPRVATPGWPPQGWAMIDCDVGQGDSEVLATADPRRAVLVDTGPDTDAVDDCLRRLGIDRIPLLVLSHLHADHIGGLRGVLQGREVGAVAVSSSRTPRWAWEQVRRLTADAGVPLVELTKGQRLTWPGLTMDVLAPLPGELTALSSEAEGTEINNTSFVLRANTSAGRVLLTGDVELQAQADLLSSGEDLHAEVVKIPHHGSRYSIPAFLDATGARVAVASVGAGNRYGHPNALTLQRFSDHGALVLRTDRDGDVAIVRGNVAGPQVVRRGQPRPPP
jgi:competence protein ComEC